MSSNDESENVTCFGVDTSNSREGGRLPGPSSSSIRGTWSSGNVNEDFFGELVHMVLEPARAKRVGERLCSRLFGELGCLLLESERSDRDGDRLPLRRPSPEPECRRSRSGSGERCRLRERLWLFLSAAGTDFGIDDDQPPLWQVSI